MALIVDLHVNHRPIGQIVAVRTDGHIGGSENTYDYDVTLLPSANHGQMSKRGKLKHDYNDGALELVRKIIVEADE